MVLFQKSLIRLYPNLSDLIRVLVSEMLKTIKEQNPTTARR
jgi:hypothetical protein